MKYEKVAHEILKKNCSKSKMKTIYRVCVYIHPKCLIYQKQIIFH